jgi:phospholipid-binding lipoprotein MlaA
MSIPRPWRRLVLALLAATALSGCATGTNPKDPYEKFNRQMFAFNDSVDEHALKPAATVYKRVLPDFVQSGVGNFFGNLGDVWTAANNFLQGKGKDGISDVSRVLVNTTLGIGGLFDPASGVGLPKHSEDLGQTLGYWGVPSGPYLMLPLLGPSTIRDTAMLPLDIKADPWGNVNDTAVRNSGIVLRGIDQRAGLLDASTLLEDAALDRYEFIRDGFLQRRQNKVFDGESSRKGAEGGDAKNIKDAYSDDSGPTTPAVPAPDVSSETAAK